jgi:hypothetical protein
MARKTRRQKQRAAARPPALAQTRLGGAATGRPGVPGQAGLPAVAPGNVTPEAGAAAPAGQPGPQVEPGPATEPAIATGSVPVPGEVPAPAPARRRVERIVPGARPAPAAAGRPAQRGQNPRATKFGSAAALVAPLETEDPAIPFDRVPYVPADLRRVAVMAGLMVVLILIAWVAVARFTGG